MRVKPCIRVGVEEPLETQLVVQDEEEHRKERNINYKQEFQERLANIDGNAKSVLLLMSESTYSTSSVECHLVRTNNGETQFISMKAQSCALQLANSLQGYDMRSQQKVVEKMFVHDVMKPFMPKCFSNLQDSINNQLIIESIKDSVFAHLAGGHTTKHATTKELLGTLVASPWTNGRKVAQHLGLFRRCVLNCKQHFLIDNGGLDFWFGTTKRQWLDVMSLKVKTLVLEWWITKTTISLN